VAWPMPRLAPVRMRFLRGVAMARDYDMAPKAASPGDGNPPVAQGQWYPTSPRTSPRKTQ
jgi:hypothetical protein